MIVPKTRLLLWLAWIGVPCAVLYATVPEVSAPVGLAGMAFVLVAVVDALFSGRDLAGIGVVSPPVVRMQKGAEGSFPLEFRNESGEARRLRIGVLFAKPVGAIDEELEVALPAAAHVSRLALRCCPESRGNVPVNQCVLEVESPLGLWAHRQKLALQTEVRVYPNLMDERKGLSALFLARGRYGLRVQRQAGKGRDFEKIREYVAGDAVEDIHWKATAKRGRPVTKVFQIERTQEVYVVIDASRLSLVRGADGNTALERFVTSALVLALATRQQGDSFGIVAFSDRLLRFVHAHNGRNHFQTCRDLLYTLEPAPVAPDFNEIATAIRLRLRKRALLIFLTSLEDAGTAEAFMKTVPPLCRQHLLVVNMIRPPSAIPIFSDGAGKISGRLDERTVQAPGSADEIYERLGGHLIWHELRERQKQLQREGVALSLFDHERLAVELVSQYLELKARQIL